MKTKNVNSKGFAKVKYIVNGEDKGTFPSISKITPALQKQYDDLMNEKDKKWWQFWKRGK